MNPPAMRRLLTQSESDPRRSWRSLVLTYIVFKVIAVVVLTPLASVLLRALLATTGGAALTDLDIVFYLLSPRSVACLDIVGAAWLAIAAWELAALLAVLTARSARTSLGPPGAWPPCWA